MPTASQLWDATSQVFAGNPLGGGVTINPAAVEGGGNRAGKQLVQPGPSAVGGGYPNVIPLTASQVIDISRACVVAEAKPGEAVPLAQPFTYQGIGTPGLQRGDVVNAMIFAQGECMTDAEARRRGIATGSSWPWYYWAAGAAGIALLAYAATR